MTEIKKCPHCGRQLHKDAQYCMYCMTSLYPKKDITQKTASRGKWWIVICVILLIVAAVIPVYLLERSGNSHWLNRKESVAPVMRLPGEAAKPQEEISPEGNSTEPIAGSEPQGETNDGNKNSVIPGQAQTTPGKSGPTEPENQSTPEIPDSAEPETQPTPESPDSTEPEAQPSAPGQCNHVYAAANCLTPTTCTLCGKTVGTPDMQAHTWKPVTTVVHHEEVGHYETVEKSYKKTVYLCFFCGYNQDGYDSLELLREHITVHANAHNYEYIISHPDMLSDTREVWDTRTEKQWVVDEKAYDETVITGYVCTLCDQQREPDA